MQEFKWNTFVFIALIAIAFTLILNIFSLPTAVIFLISTLIISISFHIYWIYQLDKWLDNPTINNLPNGYGVWVKLFTKIYRTETKQKKSKQELFGVLDQFKSAAGAILDGVITVDENNDILWCNKTAQTVSYTHLRAHET